MWKWFAVLAVVALMAGLGAQGIQAVYAQDEPAPTLSQPVMKTERFMKRFSDPLIDTLKEMLAQEPASPRDWRKIEDEAQSGAEIANLIAIRTGEEESKPEWKEMTKGMFDASIALGDSAKKRDYADAKAKFEGLVQSCNTCHQKIDPDTLPVIEP